MRTIMKDNISRKNEEIRKDFRDTMDGQFERNLYNESFSNQLESDETDTLQQRNEWWMMSVDRAGPIPNNVYDYSISEMFGVCRKTIDPEKRELVKSLRVRQ